MIFGPELNRYLSCASFKVLLTLLLPYYRFFQKSPSCYARLSGQRQPKRRKFLAFFRWQKTNDHVLAWIVSRSSATQLMLPHKHHTSPSISRLLLECKVQSRRETPRIDVIYWREREKFFHPNSGPRFYCSAIAI